MQTHRRSIKKLSIVVSVYNEEEALEAFLTEIRNTLASAAYDREVILVDDGSSDRSAALIERAVADDPTLKAIHFSRNFGHEAAMLAGIDHSTGDAVICMDADLQHPPSRLGDMVAAFEGGADIVNMICVDRKDAGWIKKLTSGLFYKMINRISPIHFHENASDFFLVSSRVAAVLKENYRERARFLRGFIQIIGFNKTALTFEATAREKGKSKYSLYRLLVLSMGAIVSFSKLPLHLGIVVGILFSLFSLAVGTYSIVMNFLGETPPGYTTLVVFMSFSFAIMFFLIGIIGIYIGYNFDENKKRPIYIVSSMQGFDKIEESN